MSAGVVGVGDGEQTLNSYEFRKDLAKATNRGHKTKAKRTTDTQPDR